MKRELGQILDTYQDFLAYWMHARLKGVDEQIELWQSYYMKKYPELLEKQVFSYEVDNLNWREIAKKVISMLPHRFELMRKARENILTTYESICAKASKRLGLDFNIIFVIYVGVGCGAGWATTYKRQPAVLMGLENIAEQKWHTQNKLKALISHEIGHLVHMKWRDEWQTFEKAEQDPLFQLYSEGFAQRCEHVILGKETWHMAQDQQWPSWCEHHKSWLANEYLKRVENQASVNDFFGSWFNIQGKMYTGYFLGHAFIYELEKSYSLRKIALFDIEKVREISMHYLKSMLK